MTKQIPTVQENANLEVCKELVRLLRLQRHDFINHIQVVHGMLQLGKAERAMQYMEELSKDSALVSRTLQEYKPENCVHKERFE